MAKQLIKEAKRLQELAGIVNENFVGLTPINNPLHEEEDLEDDAPETDDWYGADDSTSYDDEVEPTKKDVGAGDENVSALGGKQGKLQSLLKQKDSILAKFKSGQITIDQYKQEIGTIPQQIKNLQADIEQDLAVDSSEEEEY